MLSFRYENMYGPDVSRPRPKRVWRRGRDISGPYRYHFWVIN